MAVCRRYSKETIDSALAAARDREDGALPIGGVLFVEKPTLKKAPYGSVVKIETAIGTEVFAREELPICARDDSHEFLIGQLLKLFGRDRLPHPESACLHRPAELLK